MGDKLVSKEEILEYNRNLRNIVVHVKEWGNRPVCIRELTSEERDTFEASLMEGNLENLRARIVACTMVDSKGERLFSDEEVALLGKSSASVIQFLFEESSKLSGINRKDIKELKKSSETVPEGDSDSD